MEQFNTKELELERKELEFLRKELELERGKKAQLDEQRATNTDSSENHGIPELAHISFENYGSKLAHYINAIFHDEPALSDEEKKSLLKSLGKLNKRRSDVMRWKNSGKSLNKS